MKDVGVVGELWRYPFKSMGGHRLASVDVTASGFAGDRCWAVRDEVHGGIRGAKRFAELMRCTALFSREPATAGDSGDVEITLPDGDVLSTVDRAAAAARLSAVLAHPVSLWPRRPPQDLDHYRLGGPTSDDPRAELRDIFALDPDEPLPNFGRLPDTLRRQVSQYATLPGTYFDAFPILVLTTASLATLRRLRPDAVVDVRRFRPNIVIDTDAALTGAVERDWEGRRLRLGSVELTLTWRCPRCVMITHGFDDVPRDRSLMRTVVREFGHEFGIYADVTTPGRISEGERAVLD